MYIISCMNVPKQSQLVQKNEKWAGGGGRGGGGLHVNIFTHIYLIEFFHKIALTALK